MKTTMIFSGAGGQGVVSAGVMTAKAAVHNNKYATFLPEYGPEQRGGKAKCTVVIDDKEIISPLCKMCDVLICMNNLSLEAFSDRLKPNGILLVNKNRVNNPVYRDDVKVIEVPVDDIAQKVGNQKAGNIVIIGVLIGCTGIITEDEFLDSIKAKFQNKPEIIMQQNAAALKEGVKIGKSMS